MKTRIYGNMKKCGQKIYSTFKFLQGMSDEPLKVFNNNLLVKLQNNLKGDKHPPSRVLKHPRVKKNYYLAR